MRAIKRWDASGTMATVTFEDFPALRDGESLSIVFSQIPDGSETIQDPEAIILHLADGRDLCVPIEEAPPPPPPRSWLITVETPQRRRRLGKERDGGAPC